MRSRTLTAGAGALVLFAASLVEAHKNVHSHVEVLHRRHRAHRDLFAPLGESREEEIEIRSAPPENFSEAVIEKRGGQCQFPTDAGLVAVTPGSQNGGWAMSPNQPCLPGKYCPYACPPGQVSMQWNPAATSYSFPISMDGGLFCDENGDVSKPFPNQPYCQSGTGAMTATSSAGSAVSFCQTVLPGNEAMLIPTSVEALTTLAVPDPSYWLGTAAHFYINPPGVTTDEACIWGSSSSPVGNWSPYVAGANTDSSGNTFVKLGWNPVYLEPATPFRNTMPTWGVEITCSGGSCEGLPCAIDPSQNDVNEMVGSATNGAGGGAFCVVTVPKGATANFEVFEGSAGSSSGSSSQGGWGSSNAAPSTWHAPSSTYVAPSTSASPSPSSVWSSPSSSATWSPSAVAFYATSANSTSSSTATSQWSASSSSPSSSSSMSGSSPSSGWATPSQIYPLFNENSTSTWAASGVTLPTQGQTSDFSAGPAVATHTGSASTIRTSLVSLTLAALTFSLATYL